MARDRISNLEREVAELRQRIALLEGWTPATPEAAQSVGSTPSQEGGQVETEPASSPGAPSGPAAKRDLESQIGGRVVAIIGLVVLVLGAVFFLNLAFTRGWIGLAARIYIGVIAGASLWGAGIALHSRPRYVHYGQVLSAAGATIAYLALFVGHQVVRYQEATGIPPRLGLALTGAVAVGLLADAGMRRGKWLAYLAMPLMVATVLASSAWTPFAVPYTVLLTAAALGAAVWRRWPDVSLAAATASFVTLTVALEFASSPPLQVLIAAVVLLAMHVAVAFRTPGQAMVAVAQGVAWAATWGLVLATVSELAAAATMDLWLGFATFAMGATALALSFPRLGPVHARWTWAATGVALLFAWAPLMFDGTATAWAWAGLLAALAVSGLVLRLEPVRWAAAALGGFLALRLIAVEAQRIDAGAVTRLEGAPLFLAVVAALALTWIVEHARRRRVGPIEWTQAGTAVVVLLVALAALLSGPGVSLAWAAAGVLLLVAGFMADKTDLRLAGLGGLAFVLGRIVFVDLAGVDAVWRVLTFVGVGAILLGVAYAYTRWTRGRRDEAVPPS